MISPCADEQTEIIAIYMFNTQQQKGAATTGVYGVCTVIVDEEKKNLIQKII